MKNLFDYATSELSQDAFLCWLLENYDCENDTVKNAALALLGKMTELDDCTTPGAVTKLKTERQVTEKYPNPDADKEGEPKTIRCVFDIVVTFQYNNEEHALLIEDKIFSSASNKQLEIYPDAFQKKEEYCRKKPHFVIYKTDIKPLLQEEQDMKQWKKCFYIENIYSFFDKQQKSDCFLLEQYKEHIKNLYNITKDYQKTPMKSWKDKSHALLYFRAYISEKLAEYVNCHAALKKPSFAGWHSYSSLWVERENKTIGEKIKFSMEISFHPTWDRATVTVRLSGYNGNEKVHDKFKEWVQEELKKGGFFKSFKGEKWCVAQANDRLEYPDHKELDSITEKCHRLIDAFAKVSQQMNEILEKTPQWRDVFSE